MRILGTACGILQGLVVAYVALMTGSLNTWMVDDSWAAQASDTDWWMLGAQRAAGGLLIAAFTGGVLLMLNHLLARYRLGIPKMRPALVAGIGAVAITAASVAGGIVFAIQKPFM